MNSAGWNLSQSSKPPAGGLRSIGPWLVLLIVAAGAAAALFMPRNTSELKVNSDPAGASVLLNGRLAGATPLSIKDLPAGNYSLRVEKDGFESSVRAINLGNGESIISESLKPTKVGSLKVEIRPAGAEVRLDGRFLGHTPLSMSDIPAGTHELLIQKPNFESFAQRIEITDEPMVFAEFELKDKILAMLRANVDGEKHRISHYCDLAHYLFINNILDESAETYARALAISNAPIQFPAGIVAEERRLEHRLRAEDINRLNEEIRKKSHWPGKDVARFREILRRQQENSAFTNVQDWQAVHVQTQNYINDGKLERAQQLYVDHIKAAPGAATLSQAYIELTGLRLRMRNLDGARESYTTFSELYGARPELLRQAGHTIYTANTLYKGEQRAEVLSMAEKLLRNATNLTRRGDVDMNALCKFELANVLMLQNRSEAAVLFYREAADMTREVTNKELRKQKLADALKAVKNYTECKEVLTELAASPRESIATQARASLSILNAELKQLTPTEPSPDAKKLPE